MRCIDDTFINDLLNGELSPFLQEVKSKPQLLSLEVRDGYISIYYKGGSLLKITQHKRKGYEFSFDPKYCLHKADTSAYQKIKAFDHYSTETYVNNLHLLMQEMDSWFAEHPKPERDFQHTLLVSNPEIIDIEYQVANSKRFDMLAVHDHKLIMIENKYGNGAIGGKAGLLKHYDDMCEVLSDANLPEEQQGKEYKTLISSVAKISEAKKALGLIDCEIKENDITGAEILFLIAAYNQRSLAISNEVEKMKKCERRVPTKLLMMAQTESIINWNGTEDLIAP